MLGAKPAFDTSSLPGDDLVVMVDLPTTVPPAAIAEAPRPASPATYDAGFYAEIRPQTALDMIRRTPGFDLKSGDAVRGYAGATSNVLLNGRPLISKSEPVEDALKRIQASQVLRIEVIRGAADYDTQGREAMANIVLRTDVRQVSAATAFVQPIYDGRIGYGGRLETSRRGGERSLEAALVGGEGVDDSLGQGVRTQGPPGAPPLVSRVDAKARGGKYAATFAFQDKALGGALRLNARLYSTPAQSEERQVYTTTLEEKTVSKRTSVSGEAGARYSRTLASGVGLDLTLIQQLQGYHGREIFVSGPTSQRFDLQRDTGESIARGELRWKRSGAVRLKLEGEAAFNWLESDTDVFRNERAIAIPNAAVRVEERRLEGGGVLTWTIDPKLSTELALRAEVSSIRSDGDTELDKTFVYPKPRANLTWTITPGTQVRFSAELAVGQLRFEDFAASSNLSSGVVLAGNPDLEPQREVRGEVAVERKFWRSGTLNLSYRHAELSNVVDRIPIASGATVFDAPGNIGDGRRDELGLALTAPLDRLGMKGGILKGQVVRRWTQVTDPATGRGREISAIRPIDWEVHLTQPLGSLNTTVGMDLYGGWRESAYRTSEIEVRKLRSYAVVFAEYRPRKDITIRAEVQNVTERGMRRTRYLYSGSRANGSLRTVDDKELQFGRAVYLSIRRAFTH